MNESVINIAGNFKYIGIKSLNAGTLEKVISDGLTEE